MVVSNHRIEEKFRFFECIEYNLNTFFFCSFPSIEYWKQQWVELTKVVWSPSTRICSLHFEEKHWSGRGKGRVALNAIPTLHLVDDVTRLPEYYNEGSCLSQKDNEGAFGAEVNINTTIIFINKYIIL